jgi:class 3 adenylate cyclase/tetratricopeptide (TPR) repeat protein
MASLMPARGIGQQARRGTHPPYAPVGGEGGGRLRCAACGTDSSPGKRFCGECGTPFALACPSCGSTVEPGTRFCGDCGAVLATSSAEIVPARLAPPQAEPVAQRRVCSVLFCDLVGFTALSESRDPEEVRELLSGYFETASTVVGRYGGVVEKFIGDAVMAVWGTPVATEGDAERAVRAGLDVVAAVARLGIEIGLPSLAARAGVVTGEVAVTLAATNEGMVAGDAVNTASRVQSAAGAGDVLVDATTRRLSASAIGFDDAGEHTLKGKAGPEQLWRATRVLSAVGGVQRVDGLVGAVLWHRGRCLSYGEGVSFWALAEIVRQRFGIAEEDAAESAAAKFVAGLERFVPDPAEQAYVGMRLGRLLGTAVAADTGGPLSRAELFAGWRLFFERLAAVDPVVLLIEDAQYADSGLLDFVDHLIDWSRDLPMFILVFARSELEQLRPGFGTGRNRSALTLDPLDAASMEELVEALVPGMPVASRKAITGHAQGIPLFAVETVRSLIDRDVVQPVEGVYRLVGEVGELAVPDSLHALLAARLDALPSDVRRLVSDAAVLGTTFPAEALIAVSGRDDETVRVALAELLRRQVLEISADPLSPERGTYRFSQDMLRQVAYDTLSRRDRKTRHLAVAAHLQMAFPGDGEEVMDVVARHYLDALSAVPADPDTDQIRRQAITALTRAGERAERTVAPARAAASYATAAELTAKSGPGSELAAAAGLWEHAARAATRDADWATALDHAERARLDYLNCGDVRGAARAQTAAGKVLRRAGRHGEAHQQLTAALAVLRADPDADTVHALDELGGLETFAGLPDADRLTTEALTLGQALDVDTLVLADLFDSRGNWLSMAGRQPEAAMHAREAARLAEQSGDSTTSGTALLNLSNVLGFDDPAAAVDTARTAAEQLQRMGEKYLLSFALLNLAIALLATGDWDAAAETLSRDADADGLSETELVVCPLGWLAALRGDATTAETLLSRLPKLRASDDPQDRAQLEVALAFAAAARSRPADALSHARTVLMSADAIGISADYLRWAWPLAARMAHDLRDDDTTCELLALLDGHQPGQLAPMLRAERDLVRARLAAEHGDTGAAASYNAAIDALRGQSTPYHLAHGLLDHAEHLTTHGDITTAALAIEEARSIAERLGCQPLLDRAMASDCRRAAALP